MLSPSDEFSLMTDQIFSVTSVMAATFNWNSCEESRKDELHKTIQNQSMTTKAAHYGPESRRNHWATCSFVCLFAPIAHLFACSALLALLARSTELIHSFSRSLTHSRAHGIVKN